MHTVVHLLRHGAVENPESVRYGLLAGFRLSERGREQVRTAAAFLRERPIAELVTSPLERAVETAQLIEAELGLGASELDERLIEAPSLFDGMPKTAFLNPAMWSRLANPFRPSWGEPFVDVAHRMHASIEHHRDHHRGGEVVLVSHQSPIWLARAGYEVGRRPLWMSRVRCAYASITSIHFEDERYARTSYWAPPDSSLSLR